MTFLSPAPTDYDWITPDIAVGGWIAREDWGRLAREGVTAVVDCRDEARNDPVVLRENGLRSLCIPTPDRGPVAPAMIDRAVVFARRE